MFCGRISGVLRSDAINRRDQRMPVARGAPISCLYKFLHVSSTHYFRTRLELRTLNRMLEYVLNIMSPCLNRCGPVVSQEAVAHTTSWKIMCTVRTAVSYEPSQPYRLTSGLKTNFSLSSSYYCSNPGYYAGNDISR